MEPNNIRFGGGPIQSVLHPLVAIAMVIAIVLLWLLPRRRAIIPLLLGVFFIPLGQVVVLGGLHFPVLRILILCGCARFIPKMFRQRRAFVGGFNSIDLSVTFCAALGMLTFSLLYMETQALIKCVGSLIDTLGGYFLIRSLIRDREDIHYAIRLLVMISAVMALGMINERLTRRNIFWSVGGGYRLDGSSMSVSDIRDGQIRAQGPFVIYLLAGAFGATLMPLAVWLWRDGSKTLACMGLVSSTVMTITVASSTSTVAYAAGFVGLCFWPLRRKMRVIRWGLVISLIALHLLMKAPVWHLISRIDLTGSSSSYHRFLLVDNFIRHFGDWWLLGAKDYNKWGWGMWDTCNAYVSAGLEGGLATFIAFIAVIARCFGRLGSARAAIAGDRTQEWFLWCLGAAMFGHAVGFIGVVYDPQMQIAWFTFLAIISVSTFEAMRRRAAGSQAKPGEIMPAEVDMIGVPVEVRS